MRLSLRVRLLLAIVPLFVALAGLVAAGLSTGALLVCVVAIGTLAAGAVFLLTAPFERLRATARHARESLTDEIETPDPSDGTGAVADTIGLLLAQLRETQDALAERDEQFLRVLERVPPFLGAVFKEPRPVPLPELDSPWPDRTAAFLTRLDAAEKSAIALLRRLQVFAGILDELPEGVLVGDERGQVVYANAAARLLFPSCDFRSKPHLANCFGEPPARTGGDPDAPAPVPAAQTAEWVHRPHGGLCYAVADDNETLLAVSQLPRAKCKALPGHRVLLVRDLSAEAASEAAARQRQRRDVGQRLCLLVHNVATPAMEAVRTQAGLLTQTAKQIGQRERFMPKVTRLTEELDRQEIVITLLSWLGRLHRSEGTQPDAAEVRLRDVVDAVADKVSPLFRDRSNALVVQGDAGWLVSDEEWVTSLVLGVLAHANQATERQTITVELSRQSGAAGQSERGDLLVRFAGTPLPAHLAADLADPFGRSSAAALALDDGFPLGLAVAARIARLMGGELRVEGANGQVHIRALLPTRGAATETPRVVAAGRPEPAFEATDMLGGWNVGGSAVEGPEDAPDAPPPETDHTEPVPEFVEDTVGNWFGGPQS